MISSRSQGKTELIFFVNAGNPNLDVTYEMLKVLSQRGVAAVELCVPFPKSLTDGPLIRQSHKRALENGVDFEAVLELVRKARKQLDLAIVLLADYSHTVRPLGMQSFLERSADAGASATLIHCLPGSGREAYVEQSDQLGLGRVMSFFVGSDESVRTAAYRETLGFIYVVSRFGRTGNRVSFDATVLDQLKAIRLETDKPLAVGFGVKTAADVEALRSCGADAVIIGSAGTAVIERNLSTPDSIPTEFDNLVGKFACVCTPGDQSLQQFNIVAADL